MRKEEWQGCPQSTCHSTLMLALTLTIAFANAFVFEYAFAFAIRIGHRCMRYANWIRWAKFMHRRVCCPERRRPWMDWMRLELLLLTEETVGWRQADGQATVRYQHCALLHSERNATQHATRQRQRQRQLVTEKFMLCFAWRNMQHQFSLTFHARLAQGTGYMLHIEMNILDSAIRGCHWPKCNAKQKEKEKKRKEKPIRVCQKLVVDKASRQSADKWETKVKTIVKIK